MIQTLEATYDGKVFRLDQPIELKPNTRVRITYTQDEINYGQRRINYEIFQINQKLIEALKGILEILKAGSAVPVAPGTASKPVQIDLNSLEAVISIAYQNNIQFADINVPPPASEQNSESFLRVARSLNIDGPRDWSSRLDDYLYGGKESIDE